MKTKKLHYWYLKLLNFLEINSYDQFKELIEINHQGCIGMLVILPEGIMTTIDKYDIERASFIINGNEYTEEYVINYLLKDKDIILEKLKKDSYILKKDLDEANNNLGQLYRKGTIVPNTKLK